MMFTLRTNKHVKNAWNAFYNEYTRKGIRVDRLSIRDYFNIQSVISVPGARRKSESVPGVITALGIILAFIAVFAKVLGGGAEDSLKQISDNILSSFSVVIVAFILSLLYQLFDRYLYHSAVSSMQTFIGYIEQKVVPASGDMPGFDSSDAQEQTKAVCTALETFLAPSLETVSEMQLKISSMLAKTQSEGVQQMVDAFVEKLGEATRDQFEAFTDGMREQLDAMTSSTKEQFDAIIGYTQKQFKQLDESTRNINEYQEESKRVMGEVLSGMVENEEKQKEINNHMDNVVKNLAEYNERADKTQEQMANSLDKTEKFVDLLSNILETNKELNEKLSEQRIAMQQENEEYFEKMNQNSQRMSDDLNFQVESIFARFTELSTATFERLETTMSDPLDRLSQNMSEMLTTLDEQVRNISLYSKELSLEMLELNKNLGGSVKEFAEQLEEGVKNILSVFDTGLGEVSSRFATIISDIKDSADELTRVAGELVHGQE